MCLRRKAAIDLGIRHEIRQSCEAALRPQCLCARMKPVHAASASAPPTLIRRTPSAAISPTLRPMSWTTRRLSGFGATAATSASISSGVCGPGAKSTSSPAARVRPQAANGFAERIRMADVVALGSCRQQNIGAGSVDGLSCGSHTFDGFSQGIERRHAITCRVLDRQTGHTRGHTARDNSPPRPRASVHSRP